MIQMYEELKLVAAYLAIDVSLIISFIINQRTLNRMDKNIELNLETLKVFEGKD